MLQPRPRMLVLTAPRIPSSRADLPSLAESRHTIAGLNRTRPILLQSSATLPLPTVAAIIAPVFAGYEVSGRLPLASRTRTRIGLQKLLGLLPPGAFEPIACLIGLPKRRCHSRRKGLVAHSFEIRIVDDLGPRECPWTCSKRLTRETRRHKLYLNNFRCTACPPRSQEIFRKPRTLSRSYQALTC